MLLASREHYELMEQFERDLSRLPRRGRLDKEPKEQWQHGNIYQNGELNELFLAYRMGYSFAKGVYQS